ncbi:hypothetical protein MRB53_040967 [Persea americana]|nr:hypothetical protein MRB53_040967 [Persea americana]
MPNDTSLTSSSFVHTSGTLSPYVGTDLANGNWYAQTFLPRMDQYYKGDLVVKKGTVQSDGAINQHLWIVIDSKIYDFTNYFNTKQLENSLALYTYLDPVVEQMVQQNPGQDVTAAWRAFEQNNRTAAYNNFQCMSNVFYVGKTDFRDTPSNDEPTYRTVLNILGVNPKVDPPALPFKSCGPGIAQLNYGKVYAGLYEHEGHVVPYVVVVKVGSQDEQRFPKAGNRGKRDSQVLLMSFLNRVHHRSAMSPLELEIFHQINNVIGVSPELYEYLFMVDADTLVKPDSLNRLVAACVDDAKIAGICGETSLENEEKSWWTMIQVYEYYISHALAKSFESLFGSVTCLPGWGSRSSSQIKSIKDYSVCNVDTLHEKNLLALGEDRYLTTLMTKHFPQMTYKFVPEALALTAAPETWGILLSQRRRWINSTIHNLCGAGVLEGHVRLLPLLNALRCLYRPLWNAHLTRNLLLSRIPHLSRCSTSRPVPADIHNHDLQQSMLGQYTNDHHEAGEKKKVVQASETFFDPRSIPLQRWDDYALQNGLPGIRGSEDTSKTPYTYTQQVGEDYEMDDLGDHPYYRMQGTNASVRNQSPHKDARWSLATSTTSSPCSIRMQAQSPFYEVTDHLGASPSPAPRPQSMLRYSQRPVSSMTTSRPGSTADLIDWRTQRPEEATDAEIADAARICLRSVDLDQVDLRGIMALTEQRLRMQLKGERREALKRIVDEVLGEM